MQCGKSTIHMHTINTKHVNNVKYAIITLDKWNKIRNLTYFNLSSLFYFYTNTATLCRADTLYASLQYVLILLLYSAIAATIV